MIADTPEDAAPKPPAASETTVGGDVRGPLLSGSFSGPVYLGAQPDPGEPPAPDHSADEIADMRERLQLSRETLRHHLRQLAVIGSTYAPPHIMHGIREARTEIAHIKRSLRAWGVSVADHPDDEPR